MNFWTYSLILVVAYILIYTIVKDKLNINIPTNGFFYKHVNRVHLWLEISIFVIVIVAIIIFPSNFGIKFHPTLIGFTLIFALRLFMEWKYRRETKEYILTAISVITLVLIQLGEFYFY